MSEVTSYDKFKYPPSFTWPAVSVVIPLYNTEKYIGECLNSILNQTFQNFEVIVVDDCSTDSSCAIVESYAEKFGGRLALSRLEKNSGGCALPRNKGLALSRGEYIFFMDADDLLTLTALEELYTLAKNFDADVVYCEKHYNLNSDTKIIKIDSGQRGEFVDKPTLEMENLSERVQGILTGRYWVTPWRKLVRRNLLIEHEIFFPLVRPGEDDFWTYDLVFHAKRFLRVPNVVYIWRQNEQSVTRKERTPQQNINFCLNPLLLGLKSVDKSLSKHKFFRQNPQFRYAIFENFIFGRFYSILECSRELPPFVVYETIKKEFGKNLGEYDVLISALCSCTNTLQKIHISNTQKFNQFAAQAQTRIKELEAEIDRLKSKE